MKLKIVICLLLVWNAGYAQTTLTPLKFGDKVPDFTLKTVNSKTPYFRLSDHQGKVVILDFWNRWCSVCIQQFPHVVELGKKFEKDVVIMPVGFQRGIYGDVRKFYQEREQKGFALPVPSAISDDNLDSTLRKLFPFVGVPHQIWIDKDGIFRGASGHMELTERNIKRIINDGRSFSVKTKVRQKNFNEAAPLLVDGNGGPDSAFRFRSMLAGYIDSVGGNDFVKNDKFTRYYFSNNSIAFAFWMTYTYLNSEQAKKQLFVSAGSNFMDLIIPESEDSLWKASLGISKSSTDWRDEDKYCYDLILPPSYAKEECLKLAIQDFERYFKVSSSIELRPVKCLALKVISGKQLSKLKSKGGPQDFEYSDDKLRVSIQNFKISHLVGQLNSLDLSIVLDETLCDFPIDLKLSFKDKSLTEVRRVLRQHGLDLVEVTRDLNTLVLRKAK